MYLVVLVPCEGLDFLKGYQLDSAVFKVTISDFEDFTPSFTLSYIRPETHNSVPALTEDACVLLWHHGHLLNGRDKDQHRLLRWQHILLTKVSCRDPS